MNTLEDIIIDFAVSKNPQPGVYAMGSHFGKSFYTGLLYNSTCMYKIWGRWKEGSYHFFSETAGEVMGIGGVSGTPDNMYMLTNEQ